VRHVLVERDILTATKTPWLVRLLYAFQDAQHVYLAMEYVPGGDFRTLLNNSGVLKEEHARFYISEMFVAVNELHKLGYIHRDLKPEVTMCRMHELRSADTVRRIFSWTVPATLN
jgi:serine/threonine protein kinase